MVWWAHRTKYLVEFIRRKSTNPCRQGRHHAHTFFTFSTKCEMELWWFNHQSWDLSQKSGRVNFLTNIKSVNHIGRNFVLELETCYVYFKCCEVGWFGRSQAFSEWSVDKWDLAETRLVTEEERDIPNRRRLPSMGGLLNLGGFPCLAFESSTFLNFPTNKFVTEEGCLPSLVYLIFPWLAGIFILQRLLWFKTSS